MSALVLLCVDDSLQLLLIRKANLERLGFSVVTATTNSAAITALGKMAIDVVLMEYKREGIDAEAVAMQIKQRFPKVPILLLSAFSDMPERILWLVDEYVMRSEPPDGLARIIERMTRARKEQAPCSDQVKRLQATG